MQERPCWKCGEKTGGNLRNHKDDCSYVRELCEKYTACREYVAGKNADMSWSRKGPRKNKKH